MDEATVFRNADAQQSEMNVPKEPEKKAKPSSHLILPILEQYAEDAYYLHNYSITSGKNIPDDISRTIIEFKRMFDTDQEAEITAEDEGRFSNAYRKLAALMLPVTVRSLRDTEDAQYDPNRTFWQRFWMSKVRQVTLMLPLFVISLILLILSCEIIQSILISGLRDITAKEQQIAQTLNEQRDVDNQLIQMTKLQQQITPALKSRSLGTGDGALQPQIQDQQNQLIDQLNDKKTRLQEQLDEYDRDIQARLRSLGSLWESLPFTSTLYTKETDQKSWIFQGEDQLTLARKKFEIVTEVLNRLLPILYGALGAAAFLLQMLIPSIRNRTFDQKAVGSISVRICLGMLSGIALQWFVMGGEDAKIFERSLSSSALAFLAGYYIDLLFNVMDRFIGGFKTPRTPESPQL